MAPIVFTKYLISTKTRIIGTSIFLLVGLFIGFIVGVKMYYNAAFEENMKILKSMIKSRKRSIKGKESKNLQDALSESLTKRVMEPE